MEKLIKAIHLQWRHAKEMVAQECDRAGLADIAKKYRECEVFKGNETIPELLEKFASPVGMELALRHHFPSLATMRQFKQEGINLKQYGIYLDAGTIQIRNPKKVLLIGRTIATVYVDECARHEVFLLRGAKANIVASKWGVVAVDSERGCELTHSVSDNAVIL